MKTPVCLAFVALLVLPGPVFADSPPAPAAAEAVAPVRSEDIASRVDALLRRIEATRPSAATVAGIDRVEAGLTAIAPELDHLLDEANSTVAQGGAVGELDDARRELETAAAPLAAWQATLATSARTAAELLDETAREQRLWTQTRARPDIIEGGPVVLDKIDTTLAALATATETRRIWQARVFAINNRAIDRAARVASVLDSLEAAKIAKGAQLLEPDRPPLWQLSLLREIAADWSRAPQLLAQFAHESTSYVRDDPSPFLLQALLAIALMLAISRFTRYARERSSNASAATDILPVLETPYASALLLAVLAAPAIHRLAPRRVLQWFALLGMLTIWRILRRARLPLDAWVMVTMLALLVLERLFLALTPLPVLSRLCSMLAISVSLGATLYWGHRARVVAPKPMWLRRVAGFSAAALTVALLAELGGWTTLAALLRRGTLNGVFLGLALYAGLITLKSLVLAAFATPALRRSRLVRDDGPAVLRRVDILLTLLAAGLWFQILTTSLGIWTTIVAAVRSLLAVGFTAGTLSVSIGGIVAFVGILVCVPVLVRAINVVLEEEVYPRAELPRGMPLVLSTFLRYGIYSLGFFVALSIAGFQVSQVAIMIGGVGIGVGLGLQDLVGNFAAGITLLIERRLHVGDAVQVPAQQIFGRILAIGMRATVVRNWDGAEVVVPNSQLASIPVTNWTLSDQLGRIEVPVGVPYASDPGKVIELLVDVARRNENVLEDPAPVALFQSFGASSLHFVVRAWTDVAYERTSAVASDLAVALHRRLVEAGVVTPSPERQPIVDTVARSSTETGAPPV